MITRFGRLQRLQHPNALVVAHACMPACAQQLGGWVHGWGGPFPPSFSRIIRISARRAQIRNPPTTTASPWQPAMPASMQGGGRVGGPHQHGPRWLEGGGDGSHARGMMQQGRGGPKNQWLQAPGHSRPPPQLISELTQNRCRQPIAASTPQLHRPNTTTHGRPIICKAPPPPRSEGAILLGQTAPGRCHPANTLFS